MIRVTGVVRRMLVVAVGLSAVALGWVLLFEVTSPGVAAKLPTGPLAAVIALQVLPLLAWGAWRADRALRAELEEPGPAVAASVESERGLAVDPVSVLPPERPRPRNDQVMPVHRVTHMPRTRVRPLARGAEQAVDQAVAG